MNLFDTARLWSATERSRQIKSRLDEVDVIRAKHGGSLEGVGGADAGRVRTLNAELRAISDGTPAKGMVHPGPYSSAKLGESVALTKDQSMSDWIRAKGHVRREDEGLSLGKAIRGVLIGDWKDADAERKSMTESVLADGGYLVPTPLSGNIIDLVRNQARVLQAGATTIPMTAATLAIARQIGDPSGVWHAEATTDLTDSALTFDRVVLTAKTLTALVKPSRELVEDATAGGQLDQVIANAIAKALALELDKKALYGNTSSNPKEPTGVKNQSGVTAQTLGSGNGASPTDYTDLLDAVFTLQEDNFQATGMIDAPRTERTYAGFVDTLGQPLRAPDAVASVPRYPTNQVPTNLTVGTSHDTSDIFVGVWPELLIGMRTQLQVTILRERYMADSGQFGIFAWMRCDIALAHPDAFVIVEGVRP